MASIIRVKRSTGTLAPASLNFGELGLTVGVGTHGNKGGRLFAGDNSQNAQVVGGRYYTDLLSIAPGLVAGQANPTTASNGFVAILDQNRKVDQWNVDNITIDGNTVSSTNTDGDINLDPNGTGEIVIPDDTYLSFGAGKDTKIRYDETTDDRLEVEGADWNYADGVAISISDTTASSSPTTGALTVTGGVGFATDLNVGGAVDIDLDLNVDGGDITTNQTTFNLLNTNATTVNALGAATNILIGASSGIATIRNATVDLDGDLNVDGGDITTNQTTFNLLNTNATTVNFVGAATTIVIGDPSANFNVDATGNTDLGGDLNIDGDDLTTSQTTFNLLNATATSVNAFGDGTNIVIGAASGITTIRNATVDLDGDLNVDGGDITTNQTTFNLLNTNATRVNFVGAATTIVIGDPSANFNVDATGNTDLGGDLNIDGDDLTTSQTTFNLLNATATNVNAFNDATDILIGATTGIATIRNATVDLDGDLIVDGGDIITNVTGTFNLLNTNATRVDAFGAATDINIGAATGKLTIASTDQATSVDTGALEVDGGVGIAKNLHVGGDFILTGNQSITGITTFQNDVIINQDLTVQGNTTLGNGAGDQLLVTGVSTFTGNITHTGGFVNSGGVVIDNVGISSNVISTRSGGGNTLFIDPFPDGLSNEGTVIIKGDLQVDGTTTTVNSSSVTVNEPIFNLGDVTSVRTVMATVQSGVSTVTVDSVVGINTGDVLTVSNIDGAGFSTVTSYDESSKVITFSGTTTAGITTTTQITVTHAFDTNTDRGISFDYNTSSGTGNNKVGFFGYNDSAGENSSAVARAWTYIPDATVSNSVVTGTRGFLDIKGIYYQTGDYNTHGVTYFDVDGLQTSTNAPSDGSNTLTSTQILTAVTEITLALPSGATIAQGAQVTQQNNSSAYGVCKTSITSGTTLTLIGVQGTFDTTNDLVVDGVSISITPSTVTTVYTDKPLWTDTLDGGTF